jgi:hypothetical protein
LATVQNFEDDLGIVVGLEVDHDHLEQIEKRVD